jgi:hypothetical protein
LGNSCFISFQRDASVAKRSVGITPAQFLQREYAEKKVPTWSDHAQPFDCSETAAPQ